ncbi:MAG: outer membrane lipoprotein-sorting protein [Myxococcota bacterium]|nr:outer membrane lipoprotein-sorting protein [Myxococcota bacterium]
MTLFTAVMLSAMLVGTTPAEAPPVPSLEEVTKKLDDLYRSSASHGEMVMKVKTKHFAREIGLEMWSKGEERSLAVIRSPARESGTASLKTEKGLWTYAPRADRLLRIPSGMLSESWMGSHFTNDDLLKQSSWYRDYETTLKWVDRDGKRQLEMTSIPKPDAPVVYTRIVQWLDGESWIPIQADYFDGKTVIRTMHFRDIKDFQGRKIPTKIELIPHDAPGERTVVLYRSMTFDATISDDLFSPRGLRRATQTR